MTAAFIGGLFLGVFLGVLVMALAAISRDGHEKGGACSPGITPEQREAAAPLRPGEVLLGPITTEKLKGTCSHGVKWHHVCEACNDEEVGRAR